MTEVLSDIKVSTVTIWSLGHLGSSRFSNLRTRDKKKTAPTRSSHHPTTTKMGSKGSIDEKAASIDNVPSKEEEEYDEVHAGLEFPTEEEIATLRRVSDTIPWNAYRMSLIPTCPSPVLRVPFQSLLSLNWQSGFPSTDLQLFSYALLSPEASTVYSSPFPWQTNFIQWPLPPGSRTGAGFKDGQSGALGLGQRASTGLTTFYQFW